MKYLDEYELESTNILQYTSLKTIDIFEKTTEDSLVDYNDSIYKFIDLDTVSTKDNDVFEIPEQFEYDLFKSNNESLFFEIRKTGIDNFSNSDEDLHNNIVKKRSSRTNKPPLTKYKKKLFKKIKKIQKFWKKDQKSIIQIFKLRGRQASKKEKSEKLRKKYFTRHQKSKLI